MQQRMVAVTPPSSSETHHCFAHLPMRLVLSKCKCCENVAVHSAKQRHRADWLEVVERGMKGVAGVKCPVLGSNCCMRTDVALALPPPPLCLGAVRVCRGNPLVSSTNDRLTAASRRAMDTHSLTLRLAAAATMHQQQHKQQEGRQTRQVSNSRLNKGRKTALSSHCFGIA
jgi:hypothetical protein